MNDIASYLRHEFARRFPALAINITFNDDETIDVVMHSRKLKYAPPLTYTCECSSDDDDFEFRCVNEPTINLPIPR